MSDRLLELRELQLSYDGGLPAVAIDRLDVRRHEILTLMGRNGSGKSTLLRVLGLLLAPTRGEVRFDGAVVDHRRGRRLLEQRRRIAAVLQEPLLVKMSVAQNVALGLRFRGVGRAAISRRVDAWLERLQIGHLRDRRSGALSGGEAQRVSLARALVVEPELLLLDEPFAALDAPTRQSLIADFQDVLREARVTTVFATHDRGEALGFGDRVAVLAGGALIQLGLPEEVFSRPVSEEVAHFVGVETLIPGRVVSRVEGVVGVETVCGPLEVVAAAGGRPTVGESVAVCVRPEEITLHGGEWPGPQSARNMIRGEVVRVVPGETDCRVELGCSGLLVVAVVTRPSARELKLEVGREVRVAFKATAAHLIPRPVR